MAQNYKETMNLPTTDFPMRASLATREPERLQEWTAERLYERVLQMHEGAPHYILHDGPPYANGSIHMGTAGNKILKDTVVKYKSMRGFYAPYVPGWDCHGQPIEHMVEKQLGPQKMAKIDQATLRRLCRDWATKYIDIQREEFKRLGVLGDWEDPYLTYLPEYEAGTIEVFKALYEKGAIYKGRKPIHWCVRCHTALAEAEIEYSDEESDSIYVKFAMSAAPAAFSAADMPVSLLIWTTTPWTLPANVAVALAPEADYVAVCRAGELLIVARDLVDSVAQACGWTDDSGKAHYDLYRDASGEVVSVKGRELEGQTYVSPIFPDRSGVVIVGEHVELSSGTGAVHTAPGHGEDDYLVGAKYDLPILMPVDDNGTFDAGGGPFKGLTVDEANPVIVAWLRDHDLLVGAGKITHSYPHCWRCKQPVIFRATDQWFVSMEKTGLQKRAVEEIDTVEWIPSSAINRIKAMVSDRPDWCISRQRAWGVPIPVFRCKECGETIATPETLDAVIELFRTEGADAWFTKQPREYLPPETACGSCGSSDLIPEKDILDVWWESGVSHTSVLKARKNLRFPADLYLEGSDQHRGWFQSSLLTSVGAYDQAPYKTNLTHGFVVDGEGRKMSKSLGNTLSPVDMVQQYGADVVRLWVASADYTQDYSISPEIMERNSEAYRRIRNTFRFLLGTVADFDPVADSVEFEELEELDQFAMAQLHDLVGRVTAHYDDFKFYAVSRAVYDYVTELSNVYMDFTKDRLYSDGAAWKSRRSVQTVLATILDTLVRILAPILSFTCDEVWGYLHPYFKAGVERVALSTWPSVDIPVDRAASLLHTYETVRLVRDVVTKALEEARNDHVIAKSQEAAVDLAAPPETLDILKECGADALAELCIVSEVELKEGKELRADISVAEGEKCPRCWNVRTLGVDPAHPEVCERCARVLTEMGA